MADGKNDELEINLKNMGLDDGDNPADLEAFLSADASTLSAGMDDDVGEIADDDLIDFNDFSIDDLDTALSKYGTENDDAVSATQTEPQPTAATSTVSAEAKAVPSGKPAATMAELLANSPSAAPMPETMSVRPASTQNEETAKNSDKPAAVQTAEPAIVNEPSRSGEYSLAAQDDEVFKNLTWYDGSLNEKVYEVSQTYMPEFLDYDKSIKTLHVNIDSAYGWNVFFENGVFMNLMDLREYQERHGKMPGTNGKIIYGNKTTAFEKIERIVVYEKPRYFSYAVKK